MRARQYRSEMCIEVGSETAWQALTQMSAWLPRLSTVKSIACRTTGDFFSEGSVYGVVTPEGPVMRSRISAIDIEGMTVQIDARLLLLRSRLLCGVTPITATSCKITRIQAYPGLVGWLFTSLFNRRESDETHEYLTVWAQHALALDRT